jgi:hypothetical protein
MLDSPLPGLRFERSYYTPSFEKFTPKPTKKKFFYTLLVDSNGFVKK